MSKLNQYLPSPLHNHTSPVSPVQTVHMCNTLIPVCHWKLEGSWGKGISFFTYIQCELRKEERKPRFNTRSLNIKKDKL